MTPYYDQDGITIYVGDNRDVLPHIEPVHAVVTDPPSGISFMGKEWDSNKGGRNQWIAWLAETLRGVSDAMLPGAHALIWALPRTSGWTSMAIEDAGLDVRDCITHLFGSGFPKSHNLSGDWQGWGTALKPGAEFWYLARKPFKGTVAANVLQHGTGALNIDASRIGDSKPPARNTPFNAWRALEGRRDRQAPEQTYDPKSGRWPANVLLDEDVAEGHEWSRYFYCAKASRSERNAGLEGMPERAYGLHDDDGHRKPGERKNNHTAPMPAANHHPTVKPLALMRYLVTLITPPGGIVLDPFAGSGSTLVACAELGIPAIGIELSEEYAEIAARRVRHAKQQTKQAVLA